LNVVSEDISIPHPRRFRIPHLLFPSHEDVAFKMGKDSVKQKKDFLDSIKGQHLWKMFDT
jgi:hypothetical protein